MTGFPKKARKGVLDGYSHLQGFVKMLFLRIGFGDRWEAIEFSSKVNHKDT